MPINHALWLAAKRGPLEPGPAPYTAPGHGEIVIRAHAVAVNPFDRIVQALGDLVLSHLAYPAVLGTDVAGEVVAIGEGVTRFKVGDRVLGHAAGMEKARNRAAEGAFQHYVVLIEHMTSPIPDAMPFEAAAVLPLGISTAACGLFQQDMLALAPPAVDPAPREEVVIVWGGSTSVGSNAIQLAKAAGYDVLTTCSPHNFDYVRSLGASHAIDYHARDAVPQLIAALAGRRCAGALSIGEGSAKACIDVLGAAKGPHFLAQVTPPASFDDVPRGRGRLRRLVPVLARVVIGSIALNLRARRRGVRTAMIWGGSLINNEVGPLIYVHFLPEALARRGYIAAPEPRVVGTALTDIPAALEQQRQGVSARKLVVRL